MSNRTDKEILLDYVAGKEIDDLENRLMIFMGFLKFDGKEYVLSPKGRRLVGKAGSK